MNVIILSRIDVVIAQPSPPNSSPNTELEIELTSSRPFRVTRDQERGKLLST